MIPNLFISYSHRDEVWRNELVRHLRVLERSGILRIWETSEIQAGANWAAEVMEKLQQADLAVILVSPDALASDYIVDKELGAVASEGVEGLGCYLERGAGLPAVHADGPSPGGIAAAGEVDNEAVLAGGRFESS